jgi:hypothetical protein
MQPLDESLLSSNAPAKVCQDSAPNAPMSECPNCHATFVSRRGKKFCRDGCRYQYTQNLRSASCRVGTFLGGLYQEQLRSPGESLISSLPEFLDSLPTGRTDRQEKISQELIELNMSLMRRGLVDPAVRRYYKTRAAMIAFSLRYEEHPIDRELFIHAREILRDTGIEAPITAHKVYDLLGHADAAIRFYLMHRDNLSLARALLVRGNIERTFWDESTASPRFTWAHDLLSEDCYRHAPNDRTVAMYFHRSISYRLRCRGRYLSVGERGGELAQLLLLARMVDDPMLWVEHHRDYTGHVNQLLGDRSAASESLRDLTDARNKYPNRPLDYDPTILRSRIEFLFDSGRESDKEEAIALIRGKYVALYSQNRTFYYRRQILDWSAAHRFQMSVPLPKAEYFNSYFIPRYVDTPVTGAVPAK